MKSEHLSSRQTLLLRAISAGCIALVASMASAASDPLAGSLIHDFRDGNQGFNPYAGLLLDSDGQFYGSTSLAGNGGGAGTVYKLTPSGTFPFTSLYAFTGRNDGQQPTSTLVRGSDGSFYGTTASGGDAGLGTVYRITAAGALTTLHTFTGTGDDGAKPLAALVLARDGSFYGTANRGGASGFGSVFKISSAGVYSTVYSFTRVSGALPTGALVQGSDGNFYGTNSVGGPNPDINGGTVFRLTPSGVLTTLHTFDNTGGAEPATAVTIGRDGYLYGTTLFGGASNSGVVYRLNTAGGDFSVLHAFNGTEGNSAHGSLVEGIEGAFYGTTQFGGTSGKGTAYKVTGAGVFTVLANFDNPIASQPLSELAIGPEGGFYGSSLVGGTESGSVYRLLPKYTFKIAAENGVPFDLTEHPIATLRGKTYTEIKVCLTNPSSKAVTVPFTLKGSNASPLEYDILTPADQQLVFQPGITEQSIFIKTKFPPSYLQCNNTYTFTLGPSSNAAPGDITSNTLTVVNNSALTSKLCK